MADTPPRDAQTANLRPKSNPDKKIHNRVVAFQPTEQVHSNGDDHANGENNTPATVAVRRAAAIENGQRPIPTVEGYDILDQIGRGGMGIVYRAWHIGLQREVALKMIVSGQWATAEDVARLRSEATAIARLQHPNIVQIYDIGEHDGLPYYSMEYLKGGNLKKMLDGKPLPPALAASLIQDVANGVQYAHDQGFIHRDLKPDNILITNFEFRNGDTNGKKTNGSSSVRKTKFAIPKVTDFGIAKNIHAVAGQTQTGAILGTPSYMSPEQFTDSRKVGPASDIYALGAILYEMLTGRPPFANASTAEAFRIASQEDPTSPRKIQPSIPADLETICLKCLAKNPSARYASAQAMAEDLQRFRQGQPIQAKPISNLVRVWKMACRYPVASLLSLLLIVGTVVSLFLLTSFWQRAETKAWQAAVAGQKEKAARKLEVAALEKALLAQQEADEARLKVERLLADTTFDLSDSMAEKGYNRGGLFLFDQALQRVSKLPVDAFSRDLDSVIRRNIAAWNNRVLSERLEWTDNGWVIDVAYTPDGKIGFSVGETGLLRMFDVRLAKPLCEPIKQDLPFWSVAVSPCGKWLATATGPKGGPDAKKGSANVTLWKLSLNKPQAPVQAETFGHPLTVRHVQFSPDGTRLLSAGDDDVVRIWKKRKQNGAEKWVLTDSSITLFAWMTTVEFSPDGQSILTGCKDGVVQLWDAGTGKPIGMRMAHDYPVLAAAFRPDGKMIATATGEVVDRKTKNTSGEIRFWDPKTQKQIGSVMRHAGPVQAVAFSSTGRVLASAGMVVDQEAEKLTGSVRLWHAHDGDLAFPLGHPILPNPIQHPLPVWSLAFSPDETILATGSEDRHIRFFNAVTGEQLAKPLISYGTVSDIEFGADGWTVMHNALSSDGDARILNPPKSDVVPELIRTPSTIHRAAYSPDGKSILLGGDFGAYIIDRKTRKRVRDLDFANNPIHGAAFSPDGRLAATGNLRGEIKIWDLNNPGVEPRKLNCSELPVYRIIFSPNSELILVSQRMYYRADIQLWTVDGKLIYQQSTDDPHHNVREHAFVDDGKTFRVVESGKKSITGFTRNCSNGKLISSWTLPYRGLTYTMSDDGNWLLEGSQNNSNRLIDARTGTCTNPLVISRDTVKTARFSPDGRLMAVLDHEFALRLWDTKTCKPIGPYLQHPGLVDHVRFAPDGKEFLVFGVDNFVYRWKVPGEMKDDPDHIHEWLEYRTSSIYRTADHVRRLNWQELNKRYQHLHRLQSPTLPVFP